MKLELVKQPERPWAGERWEYTNLNLPGAVTPDGVVASLNQAGQAGWEAIAIVLGQAADGSPGVVVLARRKCSNVVLARSLN